MRRRTPYTEPGWPQIRAYILDRDRHTCRVRLNGCTTTATQVDHIIGWRQGGAWFDEHNLRASCAFCNNSRAHRKN